MSILGKIECPQCAEPVYVSDRDVGGVASCAKCGFRMAVSRDDSGEVTLEPSSSPAVAGQLKSRVPLFVAGASVAVSVACLLAMALLTAQNRAIRHKLEDLSASGGQSASAEVAEALRELNGRMAKLEEAAAPVIEWKRELEEGFGSGANGQAPDSLPAPAGGDEGGFGLGLDVFPKVEEPLQCTDTYKSDDFSLQIAAVRIGCPPIRDMFGGLKQGLSSQLTVAFRIANTHERKIVRYRAPNMFLGGHFTLVDDVGNVIRGVNYGVGATPVGALTGNEDINPGESASHVEIFGVPPPKTKYLVLSVDLSAFGGYGTARFRINPQDIQRGRRY